MFTHPLCQQNIQDLSVSISAEKENVIGVERKDAEMNAKLEVVQECFKVWSISITAGLIRSSIEGGAGHGSPQLQHADENSANGSLTHTHNKATPFPVPLSKCKRR